MIFLGRACSNPRSLHPPADSNPFFPRSRSDSVMTMKAPRPASFHLLGLSSHPKHLAGYRQRDRAAAARDFANWATRHSRTGRGGRWPGQYTGDEVREHARKSRAVWPLELGDRGRAPPDGLADFEAFE